MSYEHYMAYIYITPAEAGNLDMLNVLVTWEKFSFKGYFQKYNQTAKVMLSSENL